MRLSVQMADSAKGLVATLVQGTLQSLLVDIDQSIVV